MKSTWQKSIDLAIYPPLAGDTTTDVIIIGAGITGITLAYLLAKANKKVTLIDKRTLEDSMTSCTTAFLTSVIDTSLRDLVTMCGVDKARDIWNSHDEAVNDIENLIVSEKIDCEFIRTPEYFYATSVSGKEELQAEAEAIRGLGFVIENLKASDLPFQNFGGYILKDRAKFNPFKYLHKLRLAAEFFGAVIYEHTEATSIEEGSVVRVRTNHGIIEAKHCVVATHLPIKNPRLIWGRKGIYKSYVLELRAARNSLPEGLYEDDMNPYHYMRVDTMEDHSRILVGGADHRKELGMDPNKNFLALEDYVKKHIPNLHYEITTKWRGSIIETIDGLAFIGPADKNKNILYATGFSGNGMTYSMIAANIISGEILGTPHKYAYLYTPARDQFTLQGLWIKTCDYVEIFFGGYLKNIWKSPPFNAVKPIDE